MFNFFFTFQVGWVGENPRKTPKVYTIGFFLHPRNEGLVTRGGGRGGFCVARVKISSVSGTSRELMFLHVWELREI